MYRTKDYPAGDTDLGNALSEAIKSFDRKDRLMATVYMVPIKDLNDHKSFEALAFAGPTDHVSIYHNPGHAGVDMPHYHVVIWHVSRKEEARVAK